MSPSAEFIATKRVPSADLAFTLSGDVLSHWGLFALITLGNNDQRRERRLEVLREIGAIRDAIERESGRMDVLELLDRSRERLG